VPGEGIFLVGNSKGLLFDIISSISILHVKILSWRRSNTDSQTSEVKQQLLRLQAYLTQRIAKQEERVQAQEDQTLASSLQETIRIVDVLIAKNELASLDWPLADLDVRISLLDQVGADAFSLRNAIVRSVMSYQDYASFFA
jgi:hypothetical protein